MRATSNFEMSPPNSSSRFTAHGLMMPPTRCFSMPYFSSSRLASSGERKRPSGLSNTGLIVVAGLQHIDRILLHQILEPFGERGLAAADGPEQIEDLPLLLEALGGVLEVAHDPLDRVFHAVEAVEGAVGLDRAVEEDAAEPRDPARCPQAPVRRSLPPSVRTVWRRASCRHAQRAASPCRLIVSKRSRA